MAKLYCQVTGIVLLLVGALGIVGFGIPGLLSINEPAEIGLHVVLGALSTFAGFSRGGYGQMAVGYAKVFGPVYLVLVAAGLVMPDIMDLIHLDIGCTVVHLALGIWGVWAGYFGAGQRQLGAAPA